MAEQRMGELPPKYKFLLNPHPGLRYSTCPRCNKQTFPRKFPLFIHVDGARVPVILGKTCKYCSRCELIICHQDELDELLTKLFEQMNPQIIGNSYFVFGTVQLNVWRKSLTNPMGFSQTVAHMADFKQHLTFDYDPGGWRNKDDDGSRWIIKHWDAEARRQTPWTLGRHSGNVLN